MHEMAQEREGGDITAADMIVPNSEPSDIVDFFRGANVLLTGGTGFLGKLFLEKLLRTCDPNIFVLVRPKKGKDVKTRFEEIFDGPVSLFSFLSRLLFGFFLVVSGGIIPYFSSNSSR